MDKSAALKNLTTRKTQLVALQKEVSQLVRKARNAGATWEDIGNSLNITRQAAWDRYAGESPYKYPLGPDT
jgi:uncharacterized NAD(P)/FAD-binding protein YdhS